MALNVSQNIPPAAPAFAPPQSLVCATSPDTELMRRADDTRTAYYANVRRDIVLAAGEWKA